MAEEEDKIQCLLKFEWDWETRFLIIFYVNNYYSCSERLTLCMDQYICYSVNISLRFHVDLVQDKSKTSN